MINSLNSNKINPRTSEPILIIPLIIVLIMTLIQGEWRWIAGLSWIALAILLTIHQHFIFYAMLFFAPWFHPVGYVPNLPFSLKHFQAVFFMALIIQTFTGTLFDTFSVGIKRSKFLFPLLLLPLIGLINFFCLHEPVQTLRTPANLLLIFCSLFYLNGICTIIRRSDGEIIKKGISFFLLAVVTQVLIALHGTLVGTFLFGTQIIHNKHIGILCAFSSFYGLALFLSQKNGLQKNLYGVGALITTAAMIASCSRTSWFSFLVSLGCFLFLLRQRRKSHATSINNHHIMILILVLMSMILFFTLINPDIYARVLSLPQLFSFSYWRYTLNDFQNFGCLGIFRLQQLYDLKIILQTHPFLGVGFIKHVVDFHGLYFCLLGATGLIGLFIFMAFIRSILNRLISTLKGANDDGLFFLRMASFCAFLTWLLCLFFESYFVQFSAWITVFMAMLLMRSSDES